MLISSNLKTTNNLPQKDIDCQTKNEISFYSQRYLKHSRNLPLAKEFIDDPVLQFSCLTRIELSIFNLLCGYSAVMKKIMSSEVYISNKLGISRESVSRAVVRLSHYGCISIEAPKPGQSTNLYRISSFFSLKKIRKLLCNMIPRINLLPFSISDLNWYDIAKKSTNSIYRAGELIAKNVTRIVKVNQTRLKTVTVFESNLSANDIFDRLFLKKDSITKKGCENGV